MVKCYWLCRDAGREKDADVWIWDPFCVDCGPVPLCNECHNLRDPHRDLRFEVIDH